MWQQSDRQTQRHPFRCSLSLRSMFMKKFLLSSVAFLGLATAMAADLPSRTMAPMAPILAAIPVFTWTGFYIGAQVGYAWNDKGQRICSGDGLIFDDDNDGIGNRLPPLASVGVTATGSWAVCTRAITISSARWSSVSRATSKASLATTMTTGSGMSFCSIRLPDCRSPMRLRPTPSTGRARSAVAPVSPSTAP